MKSGVKAYTRANARTSIIDTDSPGTPQDTGPVTQGEPIQAATVPDQTMNQVPPAITPQVQFGQNTASIGGVGINRPQPMQPVPFTQQPPTPPQQLDFPVPEDPEEQYALVRKLLGFIPAIGGASFGARAMGGIAQGAVEGIHEHGMEEYNRQLSERNNRQNSLNQTFDQQQKNYEQEAENNRYHNNAVASYNNAQQRQYGTEANAATQNANTRSKESIGLWAGLNEAESAKRNNLVNLINSQMDYLQANGPRLSDNEADQMTIRINDEFKQLQSLGALPKDTPEFTYRIQGKQIDPQFKARLDNDLERTKIGAGATITASRIAAGASIQRQRMSSEAQLTIAKMESRDRVHLGELADETRRLALINDAEQFMAKFGVEKGSEKGKEITGLLGELNSVESLLRSAKADKQKYAMDQGYMEEQEKENKIGEAERDIAAYTMQYNDITSRLDKALQSNFSGAGVNGKTSAPGVLRNTEEIRASVKRRGGPAKSGSKAQKPVRQLSDKPTPKPQPKPASKAGVKVKPSSKPSPNRTSTGLHYEIIPVR